MCILLILASFLFGFQNQSQVQKPEPGFAVEHQHFLKNQTGRLTITSDGISYQSKVLKEVNDSRVWRYEDLREIYIQSPRILVLVTYEDQKWYAGRDRVFRFRFVDSDIPLDTVGLLRANAKRLVVTNLWEAGPTLPVYQIPVKHLHRFGGCEGVLKMYSDQFVFESPEDSTHSRAWGYRDLQDVTRPNRFQLSFTTFEPQFGGPNKIYNFQLKEELPEAAYEWLWNRAFPTNYPRQEPSQPFKNL
ncbi:MAG: hypothetical protein HY774_20350 [Acidobacteria bacterium]|nr:hypothetical protein [Acidobacteriota bacterium]